MVAEHYSGIQARSQDAFRQLMEHQDLSLKFVSAHNDANELELLKELMAGRPEEHIYNLALMEYQHALNSTAFAQYRQAHVSLRLFFELSTSGILFSAHEIDAQLWLKGRKDSNWTATISNDTGIFSKYFVGAFFEEMKEFSPEYNALAGKVYRECSEFVHGNRASFDGIDAEISFNAGIVEDWLDRADTVRMLVKLAFLIRYLNISSRKIINDLEGIAMGNFGHLAPIQALYEGASQ